MEQPRVVEEETITIGGYDESEDFEEPYAEEEDEYSEEPDEEY
jgi:hypothetical protein